MNNSVNPTNVTEVEANQDLLNTVGLVAFVLLTVYDFVMLFLGKICDQQSTCIIHYLSPR